MGQLLDTWETGGRVSQVSDNCPMVSQMVTSLVKVGGDVLLDVSRKEASLTDVDNVLMSVVRHFS